MEELEEIEIAPGTKVRIFLPEVRRPRFAAYVEVPKASEAVARARWGWRTESPQLPARAGRALVFDHHASLSHKKAACFQAREWLRRAGVVKEPIRVIVTEPPLDADQVVAVIQLVTEEAAPEPVVRGVDIEDRRSSVALWHSIRQGREELGAAIPILEAVDRVNKEFGGPWFGDDTEEFAEALVEALGRVNEVIEAIKDGDIDPEREAERWVREFESWAERAIEQGEVIEEMEAGEYKVVFAENIPPTALYVRGADIAVAHGQGRVTIGISPTTNMDDIDLRELFEYLNRKHKEGWGGRNDVGGSPKNVEIDRKEFESEVIPLIKRWLERELG